jgi:hypothetical protein
MFALEKPVATTEVAATGIWEFINRPVGRFETGSTALPKSATIRPAGWSW